MLPYREIDQSGVLFTALGARRAAAAQRRRRLPEIAATGAARTVPAGDAARPARGARELLADPAALAAMASGARAAAAGEYAWDGIAAADARAVLRRCSATNPRR